MKKIGIVGGVAWPSTVDYYSGLCRRSEQWHIANNFFGTPEMPEIVIESLNLARAISLIGSSHDEQSWAEFDRYHNDALRRLEASGADFAIIASNTPHHRFETITRDIGIPVLSIIDATARECVRVGARQVLLLGTALTMESQVFRAGFANHGVEASGPENPAAKSKAAELIADLQRGKTYGATDRLRRIIKLSCKRTVCLACTELSLAFQKLRSCASFIYDDILYINSSVCHINAAFDFAVRT